MTTFYSHKRNRFTVLAVALALIFGVGATPSIAEEPIQASKLVINIPSRTLWVYSGDKIVRYFPVGVGRPGFMTPLGQFKVIRKVVDPGWEHPYKAQGAVRIPPGAMNPLGTRWIGFHQDKGGEYGMHGTDNPGSVGRFSSHGCVRMKTPDAEKLFEMVDVGTPVDVVYQPVLIRPQDGAVRLVVYRDAFKQGMPSAEAIQAQILEQHPTAQVDLAKVRQALAQPTERPFVVGTLNVEAPATQAPTAALPEKPVFEPVGSTQAPPNQ